MDPMEVFSGWKVRFLGSAHQDAKGSGSIGSAHWDLELAVEGGRRGGEGGGRGDGRRAALIKSRDSHMAGGEQMFQYAFAPVFLLTRP